ncbi:MAG: hypothetical protein LC725_08085 [Lentisphaerae bacterium]|nr:hypothetical protein [Lentisphaerota bacterium]
MQTALRVAFCGFSTSLMLITALSGRTMDSGTIYAAFVARAAKLNDGNTTTYRLAKVLGAERANLYHWQCGRPLSAKYALKIAVYCGIDPRYLVALTEVERAPDDQTRAFWQSVADDFHPGDAVVRRFLAGDDASGPRLVSVQ